MNRRRAGSVALLLLFSLLSGPTTPAAGQDLDSLVEARLGSVASGAVAGLYDPETDLSALSAWGRPAHGAADTVGTRTLFPFPALTEFLIAVTVRSVTARTSLDATAPIARYLPGLPPEVGQITLDELLRHMGGLDDAPFPEDATLEQIVAGLPAEAVFTDPGVIYSRSRYSYPLAARVLETVTGFSIDAVISSALFEPLGMTTSTFDRAEAERLGLSTGYGATVDGPFAPVAVEPAERVAGLPVLYTSVPDVLQLLAAWMGGTLAAGPADLPGEPPLPDVDSYLVDGLWTGQYQLIDELSRASQALGHSVVLRAFPATGTVAAAWINFEGPGGGFGPDPTGVTAVSAGVTARLVERVLGPDIPVTVIEELPDSTGSTDPAGAPLRAWAGTYANGVEVIELRVPEAADIDAELAWVDGEGELPLERLSDGTVRARTPSGDVTPIRFATVRDDADRQYVVTRGKAYRRVEEGG